jgi:hypothetical protein
MFDVLVIGILLLWLARSKTFIQSRFQGLGYLMLGSRRGGVWLYTLLFLPGILIHELSHFVSAAFLGVRTGEIQLFPHEGKEKNGQVALGSVQVAKTDFVRSSLIGAAPFFTGSLALFALVDIVVVRQVSFVSFAEMVAGVSALLVGGGWRAGVFLYGILVVGNTMFSSDEDKRSYPILFFFLALFAILLIVSGYSQQLVVSVFPLVSRVAKALVISFSLTALLQVILVGILLGIEKVTMKVTKKRIVYGK